MRFTPTSIPAVSTGTIPSSMLTSYEHNSTTDRSRRVHDRGLRCNGQEPKSYTTVARRVPDRVSDRNRQRLEAFLGHPIYIDYGNDTLSFDNPLS